MRIKSDRIGSKDLGTSPRLDSCSSVSWQLPPLSPASNHILNITGNKPSPPVPVTPPDDNGPWSDFRRLLRYYQKCLRAEEGAEAMAYQNQLGERFVYLGGPYFSLPQRSGNWEHSISADKSTQGFFGALPPPDADDAVVIGYPVAAVYKEADVPVSFLRPIFYFPVEHMLHGPTLTVRVSAPAEVNHSWLEFTFKNNPEKQRAFLAACGSAHPNYDDDSIDPKKYLSISELARLLQSFMPNGKIREPLITSRLNALSLSEPFKNGIYNRAVLMLAKKTKYTVSLLRELKTIEQASDEILDRTALVHLFKNGNQEYKNQPLLEGGFPEPTPLNTEQRRAVASLLANPVTVVTGPPGTGKSQVAAAVIAGARLKNKSVLLCSRNHKAIDAVTKRTFDPKQRPLLIRANSKDDSSQKYTLSHALADLLKSPYSHTASEKRTVLLSEVDTLLEQRARQVDLAYKVGEVAAELGRLEEQVSLLKEKIPPRTATLIDKDSKNVPVRALNRLLRIKNSFNLASHWSNWLQCLCLCLDWFKLRTFFDSCPDFPQSPSIPTPKAVIELIKNRPLLEMMVELASLRSRIKPLEERVRQLPLFKQLVEAVSLETERLAMLIPDALVADIDGRQGLPPSFDRQTLDNLRHAWASVKSGQSLSTTDFLKICDQQMPVLLSAFPCWAVTSLSAGSHLPLCPGMYDLLIIDEASQSDTPSAIPLLFRSRRLGVLGDPWQLKNITKLKNDRDNLLFQQAGLGFDQRRLMYTANSFYDVVAGSNGVEPQMLTKAYRSAPEIAEYSSTTFYGGRLQVATSIERLAVPHGFKPGIHWTDITGPVCIAGSAGCYCQDEIDEITRLIRKMLLEDSFKGSVGVVTPFRQQANRIRDALYQADTLLYQAFTACSGHVDTAHGFQGDERDVIFFSLCAGPEMPQGSMSFISQNAYLFNVAASRARALLHLVGNRQWAKSCGLPHIENLAYSRSETSTPSGGTTPWHPHESPWEQLFCQALTSRGLEPRPQLPVLNRRLDLALVDGSRNMKIDLEVDGDCHRGFDGMRKPDDVWRDMQLQGAGWKVMRFWTYQLRENMDACVEAVENAWRNNGQTG